MIDLENYNGTIKFGDENLLNAIKSRYKKDLETSKITIDFRKLMKVGLEKNQALNLIERLLNLKK
jgi:hypothetical protein